LWRDRRLRVLHLLWSLLIAGIWYWVWRLDLLKETSGRLRSLGLSSLGLHRLLLVEIGCLLRRLASEAGICDLRLRLGLAILLSVLMLLRRALDLRLSVV
jgi:hypothetical protein